MEVANGKFGLRLISWMIGAGILCHLPKMESASSCPDLDNKEIPCPMNELAGVDCTYMKGVPQNLSAPVVWFPGPVIDLDVKPILKYSSDSSCLAYLNITWKINYYGNCQWLRGFLLNVTFLYNGTPRYINRTYNLSVADWTSLADSKDEIYATDFRHECIQPATNTPTFYQIEVHSLPLNTDKKDNFATISLETSNNFLTTGSCGQPINPNINLGWTATMWVKRSPSADINNTLEVCFFYAPVEFNFTGYKVSLVKFNSTEWLTTSAETYVYDNGTQTQDRLQCVEFINIRPDVYNVWVSPLLELGPCFCRGPTENDYPACCTATTLGPIDMTSSTWSSTSTTKPLSAATEQPLAPAPPQDPTITIAAVTGFNISGNDWSDAKVAGIVLGFISGLAIIAIAIALYILKCRKQKLMGLNFGKYSPGDGLPTAISKRQSVLLIYSTDNDSHRKVVRTLAAFLHACCGCNVLYDQWSQVDIAQTNPIDWLTKQMYHVKHVIVVNSLGAHEQHRGWIEQKQYVPVSNLLLPDVFIPAIRLIQNKVYLGSPQLRCFHVYFPYTEQQHVLDLSFGRHYKLMDHIEDLFLHIHGMTKFSAKGTTFANQINATSYYIHAKEGKALHDAIQEACEYTRDNSDWFQKHYKLEDVGSDDNNTVVQISSYPYNRFPRDVSAGSVNSNEERGESKTSSIGFASDMDYIPPSVDGSYNGDVEIHSVSPDFGIEGMNDEGVFEASSPPMFIQFTPMPPADLDDVSSIGSLSFVAKVHELNEQFDSGIHSRDSMHDFRTNLSDC